MLSKTIRPRNFLRGAITPFRKIKRRRSLPSNCARTVAEKACGKVRVTSRTRNLGMLLAGLGRRGDIAKEDAPSNFCRSPDALDGPKMTVALACKYYAWTGETRSGLQLDTFAEHPNGVTLEMLKLDLYGIRREPIRDFQRLVASQAPSNTKQ